MLSVSFRIKSKGLSRVVRKSIVGVAVAAALSMGGVPAQAQKLYSDGYSFLKAVRERDGTTATNLIVEPGSTVINSKERGSGDGALHILARERDITWLGFLLGKGAKANLQNGEGNTALIISAQIGWIEGAERLLRAGASVDLANNRGETPLILAVQNRNIAMVRLLLGKGANPRKADSIAGYSALDYAKQDGRAAAILKLLEEGVEKKPAIGPSL
jgi:ankyrin repeat protein